MSATIESVRRELLGALLPHVPFDGFSRRALEAACRDTGIDKATAMRAFPRGGPAVVDYFFKELLRETEARIGRIDMSELRVRDRIGRAVRIYLEVCTPHREAFRRALGQRLFPGRVPQGLRGLYDLVDLIWRSAGDRSTDFNFYTKRGLLSGVLVSTILCWLEDRSPDLGQTWAFLDRRIEQVLGIQKARGRLERVLRSIATPGCRSRRIA